MLRKLLMVLVFLLAAGAFVVAAVYQKITEKNYLALPVEVLIPKGAGLNQAASVLEKAGIIRDARLFVLYARLKGLEGSLKAGEYSFSGGVSVISAAELLVAGEVIVRSLTIPEGKALAEIKKIVNDSPYLSGEITLALQEGEILPETYHFTRGETRDSFLRKARQAMKNELSAAYQSRSEGLPLKNEEELLILASIIEKETGLAEERGKVASVFINRLNKGIRLQTDPTVIYAVTNGEMNLGRPLYKRDLVVESPYNTYLYAGLPPTPICSPGKAALQAAAHPEQTKYLYFVADGVTGGHAFAENLSEHNKNVAAYRRLKK